MPTAKNRERDPILATLQTLLIVQLASSGIDNHSIRRIAGVQMSAVTRISKALGKAKRRRKG
jgi:hypothetical protein